MTLPPVAGETPLTFDDMQGLKLTTIRTREQLSIVEGQNILGGKQWALASRRSRLLADVILEKHFARSPLAWGGNANLGNTDPNRERYLAGLKAADKGDYRPLMILARSA